MGKKEKQKSKAFQDFTIKCRNCKEKAQILKSLILPCDLWDLGASETQIHQIQTQAAAPLH
jgi:hypothetical protein